MRRVILVGLIAALMLVPVGVARAPTTYRLSVDDVAELAGAKVRCVARSPTILTCGGGTSKIFVQFRGSRVWVFRAVGRDAIFRTIFEVRR